ncbi:uncharacterized protein VP01_1099g3 [Puccinia sorghi]|uniref:Uncharacterized protein n=1 Tax=Puccinia sorghi TaxID=27349 RepID=A0A0L6VSX7_9BASI|nr:uncharacterized protein VP01_1099g3 [Puccinia sorghi]
MIAYNPKPKHRAPKQASKPPTVQDSLEEVKKTIIEMMMSYPIMQAHSQETVNQTAHPKSRCSRKQSQPVHYCQCGQLPRQQINSCILTAKQTNGPDQNLLNWTTVTIPIVVGVSNSNLLLHFNQCLPQINIPTFISCAIPVLGQASNGDKWRKPFTIQPPLQPSAQAHYFFRHHCAVPLTQPAPIHYATLQGQKSIAYKAYLITYRLKLFPDSPLVPNHHISLHIPWSCLSLVEISF